MSAPVPGPVTGDIDAAAVKVALGQAEAAVAHPRDREREDAPDRFTEAVADDFVLPPNRIGVAAATRQSLTMTGRGLLKIKHNPQQLFDVIVLPIVFTVMFSTIFGGAIAGDVTSYLPLLIPGLLVQVTVAASVITGVQLREDLDKGVFDRFKSLPIARIAPLAGALLANAVRYVVATAITVCVGLAMGYRPGSALGLIAACGLVVLVAFTLSWIFALLGVLLDKASTVQGVSMLVMMPITFVSNALVPVDSMPGWMQACASANPVSHLVTAARELATDGSAGVEIAYTLAGALAVLAICVPITLRTYMRRT
ncbi:ABC-2 type transport system permease protein [Gordonia amarae]|uniref:Transport permease protein n=2 Tax=Gordonia amarae TaxID=36821 RepID=G7GKH5_9ACTN|nr:ABC-2 type transport system permease protein [Gordonia amarae]GAB04100.1 putative ABC transporter permease protein [Gordonia amarae NBRC 15530]